MTSRPLISPNTGTAIGEWTQAGPAEAETAVALLSAALPSIDPLEARKAALDRLADGIDARREEIESTIVREVAKTPVEAAAELDYALSFVRYARSRLDEHDFDVEAGPHRRVRKVGYGTTLLIAPFNDPVAGLLRKIAPSLAAGSTALVKPSAAGTATALAIGAAIDAAGLGDLVRVLPVSGQVAERMIDDARIGLVSFTGSTATGLAVAARAASASKPAVTELGGNNPFVICTDADLDRAIDHLVARKLRAAGQACSAVNRVYVHRDRAGDVRERLAARAAEAVLGPSDRPGVTLAPVISAAAADRLRDLVATALAGGARALTPIPRGLEPDAPFLVPFTILDADGPTVLDHEEAFGPVLAVTAFDDERALFDRLAREQHALAAYIYTADPRRLGAGISRLRFGSLGINTTAVQAASAPTGGFRLAGVGREGGPWGLDAYLTTINVVTS
jgi:acyl-CoA reductase-like NAD-dependent aldehyde dehydrogenase